MFFSDITPQNVVCGLNIDLGKMNTTDKYKLLGRPRKARISEDNEVVGELVAPAKFPSRVIGSDAYLCDFGILVKAGTPVINRLQSPADYCAPELFHNIEPGFASDIWSYRVVFLYLYTETTIFTGRGFAGRVSSIVKHAGGLPSEWLGRYELYDKEEVQASWYGQGSKAKDAHAFSAFLDQQRPDISAKEKTHVLSVIQKVFQPRPQDRLTASELLEDVDFKAVMSMNGV